MRYEYKTTDTCSQTIRIEDKLLGITCGRRPTSYAHQLEKAVSVVYSGQTK